MSHPAGPVVLELRCCCCGRTLDTLVTPWSLTDVRPESIWTREPCVPCEVDLALEDEQRQRRVDLLPSASNSGRGQRS